MKNSRTVAILIAALAAVAGCGDGPNDSSGDDPILDEHIVLEDSGSLSTTAATLDLDENVRGLIREALKRAGGNKTQAAELLGITRRTLYSRLKLLGMEEEFGEDQG